MKFNTMYLEQKKKVTNPGSPIKEEYQLRITDNGAELVMTGKSNLYEEIQAHKDTVDIHKILDRCAMMDDYSILNRMPAEFMDTTEAPKTLAEAYAMVQDAENFFNNMPVSVKNEYENNFVHFIKDIGSDHFNGIVSNYLDSINNNNIPVEPITEEKTNES